MDWESLIFDRTEDDVTEETAKGFINADDFNRWNRALIEISDAKGLNLQGLSTSWQIGERLRKVDLDTIYNSLKAARQRVGVFASTPKLPDSFLGLTWEGANAIEKNLYDMHQRIEEENGS